MFDLKSQYAQKLVLATLLASGTLIIGGAGKPAPKPAATSVKQVVTGPVAQYWVSSTTSSGFGAMMGGGKPSMGDIMGMMGGGSKVSHSLKLQLGSNQTAIAEATGDHVPEAPLGTGVLPLYYKAVKSTYEATPDPKMREERDPEPPKGRILIFWGCGERARPGQPIEIDLSKITDPSQRAAMMRQMPQMTSIALSAERPPSPDRFKSYAEWPNEKSRKSLTGQSSLLGTHKVASAFSPNINFTLGQSQDFLAPLDVNNAKIASGAVMLNWRKIDQARAYIAYAIGGGSKGRGDNTMVIWSSSSANIGMNAMAMDYLNPADAARLVNQGVLMGESVTQCAVPAEAIAAAPSMMYTMTAYGNEANFSYPERPSDPKIPWNIQWTTKVRYKSTTGGILGQDMGAMGRDTQGEDKPKKKKSIMGELIKGALIP